MKRAKKSCPFTLIEILIALSILASVSVLMGVKVAHLLKNYRFKASTEAFLYHMKELQALALSHSIDMELYIYKDKKGYQYVCHNDAGLIKGTLFDTPVPLKELLGVRFDAEPISNIRFLISSSGRISPRGILSFLKEHQNNEGMMYLDTSEPYLLSLKENR